MSLEVRRFHSHNKTNEMHHLLKFIFEIELYMFWTDFLSIIRGLVLYTQQNLYDIAVYTALDSWWWTENLSETFRVVFQK
jgi:hypothetical protein